MTFVKLTDDLGISVAQLRQGLTILQQERQVTRKGIRVTLPPRLVREGARFQPADLYAAETGIARHIRRLQAASLPALEASPSFFGALSPDASQLAALEMAAKSNVVVMTGGPGVGKTTVAKAMLDMYAAASLDVACCAPTGKAARRMREQTGRSAKTIHQTIGLVPGGLPRYNDAAPIYTKDGDWIRNGPLDADAVITDETSLTDVRLLSMLLAAIRTGARVLIVGDVDQLPSIGAGRTLYDLICSRVVPVVRLTKIHRQASDSRIPYVARDINEGRCPDLSLAGSDAAGVRFWESPDAEQAAAQIAQAITDPTRLQAHTGAKPNEIQVLAPQKAGPCGVKALNLALQAALNSPRGGSLEGDVFIGNEYSARLNDRVLQTKNNYELGPVVEGVMDPIQNGEIGYVVAADPRGLDVNDHLDAAWSGKTAVVTTEDSVATDGDGGDGEDDDSTEADGEIAVGGTKFVTDESGERHLEWNTPRVLVVDFGTEKEPRLIAFTKDEARELELGYCITVHKSQGSQFKVVVMALHSQNVRMLNRPLLYTGITRAEKYVLMVGTSTQVAAAARNTRGVERRTTLQERLTRRT